ncbi:MAG: FxsA protein, partial [Pauljensenia sp.]
VRDQWSPVVPLSCLLCAAAVLGDQLGGSFRSNSLGAVGVGAVTGAGSALALELLGFRGASPSALLPGLVRLGGETAAAPVFGLLTGVAVALAVIAVDGLLGDHLRRSSGTGAIARGTAKFMVAVLPIYALIRVGGI